MKRAVLASASLTAIIITLLAAAVIASAGPFESDSKPPQQATGPKGTPIPPPADGPTPGDDWISVAPESRTDIQMIDVVDADLFLPSPADAADCADGDLDPAKAEAVIRKWLTDNKSELPHEQVWDQTLIGVTCAYPSEDHPGKVALHIGVPYVGHSFLAPRSCLEKMDGAAPDAPLPPECIPPDEDTPSIDMASYTIVVNPEEVLK